MRKFNPKARGAGKNAEESIGDPQPVERLGPRRYRVGLDRVGSQRNIDHGSPPGGLHSGPPYGCRGECRSNAASWPPTSRIWTQQGKGPRTAPFPTQPTSVGHGVEVLARGVLHFVRPGLLDTVGD